MFSPLERQPERPLERAHGLRPGVRLRPVPEMGICLAYRRHPPALHNLNAPSWLIATLCDGRPYARMLSGFIEAYGYKPDSAEAATAAARLDEGVAELIAMGLVQVVDDSVTEQATCGDQP